ncbi:hypothetical protein BpHYR1_038277 [Brachionus plicatilis]|uniref:Uncharacterized protein n=1 Tax=Brachionus plicatilis TaxID=10195 RepID=A0A3M7RVJ3_BRAPC|nr:hypothetical protein BpHYR1_038277 [Brachionus plicatilis]
MNSTKLFGIFLIVLIATSITVEAQRFGVRRFGPGFFGPRFGPRFGPGFGPLFGPRLGPTFVFPFYG